MKKYSVYFHSMMHGEFDRTSINAESFESAYKKYLVGKESNNFESVVVSPFGWINYFISGSKSFPNPLFKPSETVKVEEAHNQAAKSATDISKSFYLTSSLSKTDSGKLDKLIELQEKQLFWIRIIGIPFLLAAIGYFIALIIRALN